MKTLIKVENLNYVIPYGPTILEGVSFELKEGEFIGVLGRNGVGKTTLMDLLLGFRPSTSGLIEVLGENPIDLDRKQLRSICFLSHEANSKGNLTISQYLKFFSQLYPGYSIEEEKYLMNFFSLNPTDKMGALSTGQQKKVQAVAVFSSSPKVVLIDEITAVLDPETRNQFFNVLQHYKEKKKISFILATNIAEDLINRADKVLFIDHGRGVVKNSTEIYHLFKIEKSA